ncbi:MAG: nucleotidyltransferase domain-containing protein [Xenococcaceae cyanobacterium MO_188.B29]|nr:nucleotidyltransferase domain-containing protein [Xenococcaceae cyanobacterium MO_188.B29]
MVSPKIQLPEDKIKDFSDRWKISELALFGSVLRDDFRPDSDIDVLVTFSLDADWSLFDHVQMQQELVNILKRKVDLVSKRAIERSHNWIRRREILETAKIIYVK